MLLAVAFAASAATVTATWDRNTESTVTGYRLSYGTQSGNYGTTIDVGNVASYQLTLSAGARYYFVVQAYDSYGQVSPRSTEAFIDIVGPAAPVVTSLSPSSGPVGSSFTISGSAFGSTQGTSTVRLNGATAAVTSWSATSIVATVPAGATTGSVVVTVNGVASNASTFTVTSSSSGAITLTQQRTIETGGGSASLGFASNNTAGNFIAVAVRAFYINQNISVSDSRGNVYRQAFKLNNVDGSGVDYDDTVALFYAENVSGGANTVTVSISRAASLRFAILEYKGVATSSSLNVTSGAAGRSNAPNSGTVTTTVPGALVLGVFSTQSTTTFSPGSGFTAEATVSAPPSSVLMVADRVLTNTGSVSAAASLSTTDIWAAGLAAFRPAGSTGGTPNSPPVLTQPSNQTSAENSSASVQLSATDPNGNTLTYSATGLPGGLAINAQTGLMSGTLSYTSAGTYNVTATVSDGSLTNSKSFTWTVTNTNRPPVLTQPSNQTNAEGSSVSVQLSGSDPDGTSLTYSASGLPSSLSVNSSTGLITGTLSSTSSGSYTVTATVSDGSLTNSKTFTWTVTDVASAPTITSLSPTSGPVGTAVTINGSNFGATQGSSVVRFNGTAAAASSWSATRIVAAVPSGARSGNVTVTVGGTASNGVAFSVSSSTPSGPITLTQQRTIESGGSSVSLAFNSSNTAGGFIAVAVRAFYTNQSISVTDTNGNAYRRAFQVNNVEPGSRNNYDDTLALFYAENIAGGSNTVTVSISTAASLRVAILEYSGVAASSALDVTRTAAGKGRSISTGSATTTTAGDLAIGLFSSQSTKTFTAGSGFTMRSAVSAAPSTVLMVADRVLASAGALTATSTINSSDIWAAGVAAFKAASAASSQTSTQTLMSSPLDAGTTALADSGQSSESGSNAPQLAPIADQRSLPGSSISLPLVANDADGDALTYSAIGLPGGVTLDVKQGIISGTLTAGTVGRYVVTAAVSDGTLSASRTFKWIVANPSPASDYDGDGKSDVAVYRPGTGAWQVLASGSGFAATTYASVDNALTAPGDFDGDGRTDIATYRQSTNTWSILKSTMQFGVATEIAAGSGSVVPVPGDYDGDGATDAALYDASSGRWQILSSKTSFSTENVALLGAPGDIPVPGDYDGDGRTDPAVYQPATGVFRVQHSTTDFATTDEVNTQAASGTPAAADFDGDGITDIAVYQPTTGWTVLSSSTGFATPTNLGAAGADAAVPTDFDGDGKADLVQQKPQGWQILTALSGYRSGPLVPGNWKRGDIVLPAMLSSR
jgi:hypothetical protein